MQRTRDNVNRQFATQKAISMLEELRALIQTQSGTTTIVLDDYDNGVTNVTLLTTQLNVTDPAHPASGNRLSGGTWLFSRRITVQKMKGVNDLRLVNVKVFVEEPTGPRLLAEVAGVLSTIGQNAPPTQVYDVYLIAIENVPGWWLHMQNIVPFVEGAMQDLEARHPGLQFRKHWIRKLSYGRDPFYTPYVNRPRLDRHHSVGLFLSRQDAKRLGGRQLLPARFLQRTGGHRRHVHQRLRRGHEPECRTCSPISSTTACRRESGSALGRRVRRRSPG